MLVDGSLKASLTNEGITVDNLRNQPVLHWAAFQEAVCILIQSRGRAKRGDAMGGRLGNVHLPLDSFEGHIALVVSERFVNDDHARKGAGAFRPREVARELSRAGGKRDGLRGDGHA